MREKLEKELEKIGLSEKEAKVYLAALELGPSTAQSIAAKATVNRPTTYIMIESLIKRGLMSSFEKGKKRYFVAGKPNQLLFVLASKKRELEEQEKILADLLPLISEVTKNSSEAPLIEIFEGSESTKVIQDKLLNNSEDVLEIVPLDLVRNFIPPIFKGDLRERFHKLFSIKSLYTSKDGPIVAQKKNLESRFLPPEKFPFSTEILIFGNTVIINTYSDKQISIHIKSPQIANSFKILFLSLWNEALKFNKV